MSDGFIVKIKILFDVSQNKYIRNGFIVGFYFVVTVNGGINSTFEINIPTSIEC